ARIHLEPPRSAPMDRDADRPPRGGRPPNGYRLRLPVLRGPAVRPRTERVPPCIRGPTAARTRTQLVRRQHRVCARGIVRGTAGTSATKLPELLLIEVLRLHLASAPASERGWLAGVRDPVLAP